MQHSFFISHYSGDKQIAEIFSKSLSRITLEQIRPWFSSDSSGNEGLKPGDIWFNQILGKLMDSRAVVALLTPNSINRPWVYFESGIAQALEDCDVIPVCIGVKRDSILPPLGLYQCYQLNDYRSVVEFFSKLLSLFSIKFDEEMSKVIIEKMVSDISQITFKIQKSEEEPLKNIETILQDLKSHLDKRFVELLDQPKYTIVDDNPSSKTDLNVWKKDSKEANKGYSVEFHIDFIKFKTKVYIDVRDADTFQDLTNTLYFIISEYVKPFKYLEEWIIINIKDRKHVVIREIADQIPAKLIFKPGSRWTVKNLTKPYNATDSGKRIK